MIPTTGLDRYLAISESQTTWIRAGHENRTWLYICRFDGSNTRWLLSMVTPTPRITLAVHISHPLVSPLIQMEGLFSKHPISNCRLSYTQV